MTATCTPTEATVSTRASTTKNTTVARSPYHGTAEDIRAIVDGPLAGSLDPLGGILLWGTLEMPPGNGINVLLCNGHLFMTVPTPWGPTWWESPQEGWAESPLSQALLAALTHLHGEAAVRMAKGIP